MMRQRRLTWTRDWLWAMRKFLSWTIGFGLISGDPSSLFFTSSVSVAMISDNFPVWWKPIIAWLGLGIVVESGRPSQWLMGLSLEAFLFYFVWFGFSFINRPDFYLGYLMPNHLFCLWASFFLTKSRLIIILILS